MTNGVVVTGAGGFVGSHLVERLLAEGHTVTGFDLQFGHGLDQVRNHPRLRLVSGDVRDPDAVARCVVPGVRTIYHLSAVVGVKHYVTDPLAVFDVNVTGTRNVLTLAERVGARFLLASTSEVYGKNPRVPWAEDNDRVLGSTTRQRWSYSTSKAASEHLVLAMKERGLHVTICRLFNAYGPRQLPHSVISQTIHRVLRGERPEVYDGGSQTRCFTYVADVVDGLVSAATLDAGVGEVFNIGSERESTVLDAVRLVIATVAPERDIELIDTQLRFGSAYEDIPRRIPDASKAARILGWRAATSLEDGIKKTVAWALANPWWWQQRSDGR